jgi:hypothetical protein
MQLRNAIEIFASRRGKSYPVQDLEAITEAVTSLGLKGDFIVKEDYVTDPDHIIHIHPTMIVAAKKFPGSVNRGPKPYLVHVYFKRLSGWKNVKA